MSQWTRRAWRGLTRNIVVTDPHADDPRLGGRTYAIPFEQVWQAALTLASGRLKRWRLVYADDQDGIIRAEAQSFLFHFVAEVTIRIGLDADAQTRVDARSRSRKGRADLGLNARLVGKFFRMLDRTLAERRSGQAASPQRIGG